MDMTGWQLDVKTLLVEPPQYEAELRHAGRGESFRGRGCSEHKALMALCKHVAKNAELVMVIDELLSRRTARHGD